LEHFNVPNKLISMIMSLGIETCKRRSLGRYPRQKSKNLGKTLNHIGKDMSIFAHLDIEFDQGIATIVLNRPPANAAGRWADPHLATRR
jgi:hypothetical protein